MDLGLVNILVGAFAAGFLAFNVRDAKDASRGVLIGLALGGALLMVLGIPELGAPWGTALPALYAAGCLLAVAYASAEAWKVEPRRVVFAASEATAALGVMITVLSFA